MIIKTFQSLINRYDVVRFIGLNNKSIGKVVETNCPISYKNLFIKSCSYPMKTVKLPIKNKINLSSIQSTFSSCVRFSYNRFIEDKSQKDIREIIRDKSLYQELPAYITQCAILDAKSLYEANIYKEDKIEKHRKVIFGGLSNLIKYLKKKITKEEYKEHKLLPITIQGEACKGGNRHIDFKIVDENKIVFKFNKDNHYEVELPELKKNLKKELYLIDELAREDKIAVTIKLTSSYVCFTYDEKLLVEEKKEYKSDRVLGIDMNPNYIGFSILEFSSDDSFKVLKKEVIDLSKLNTTLNLKSSDPKRLEQNNKRKFETIECAKYIVNIAKVYMCSKIVLEDLSIKSSNKGHGNRFNRQCNNEWLRSIFVNNLRKRCNLNNIELVEINCAYSSTIGNVLYGSDTCPDMVASSIEISRRGYKKYEKRWFYPEIPSVERLNELWKQTSVRVWDSWVELHRWIKESKVRYRFSLEVDKASRVLSFSNIKSRISLYLFI